MTATGFVGLGQIGRPMAQRLAEHIVYDVRTEATEGFRHVASSAAEVARRCEVISVMVKDDKQVRDVVGEMLPQARAGTVIAVHSTISPELAPELAASAARSNVFVLDAPVSGGAAGAANGTLAVMVGGPEEAVNRCREPFSSWASMFVHTGEVGSGTRTKLARNLVTFVSFAAASEAQRLAEAAGIDLVRLGEVVRHSDKVTGGPGAIMFRDTTAPVASDDPWRQVLAHTAELGQKDLSLVLELGDELGVELEFARLALQKLTEGLGVG